MVEQAKFLLLQKQNIDAIQNLFVLYLRTDLCCIQIWPIQYGRHLKFLVIFLFLASFFSKLVEQAKILPLQK